MRNSSNKECDQGAEQQRYRARRMPHGLYAALLRRRMWLDVPGEGCDDGNNTAGDGCQADCMLPFCGDGIPDPGETCDDGNGESCDGCTTYCVFPTCGDGFHCPGLGEDCDDGNSIGGDGCENDCTATPVGTFEITRVSLTPDVNVLGGVRPRFTDDMAIDVVVETTEGMTSVQAEVVGCDPAEVSDCTPVSDTPPSATSWSLRLPGFVGSASGTLFTVQVTAEGPGSEVDQQTVDLEVYPVDPGLDVTCTKRYDSGSLYVSFTLVDNGNLPIGYTLSDMFDARFYLWQEGQATGFALDETDSFRGDFLLDAAERSSTRTMTASTRWSSRASSTSWSRSRRTS